MKKGGKYLVPKYEKAKLRKKNKEYNKKHPP